MPRRFLISSVVVGWSVLSVGSAAPAHAAAIRVVTTEGASANAILTKCSLQLPVGTHCEAWVINMSRDRLDRRRSSTVSVTHYDVEILTGGYSTNFLGSGSANAQVTVDRKLDEASVHARVPIVLNCEAAPCPTRNVELELEWKASGPTTTESGTFSGDFDGCHYDVRYRNAQRPATAKGEVDDVKYVATQLVIPPQISTYHQRATLTGSCDGFGVADAVANAGRQAIPAPADPWAALPR